MAWRLTTQEEIVQFMPANQHRTIEKTIHIPAPSRHSGWIVMILMLAVITTGCVRIEEPATPSPSPLTPTSTPTVFFPTLIPTATSTPQPSPTPMPERLADLGELLFEDDFSNDRGWVAASSDIGGISLVNERLAVAVRRSQSYFPVISPASSPNSFYAEVTVRAELCSDNSDIGLMYHLSSSLEHYRFTINCSGEAQVILAYGGSEIALVPLTSTNVARPGALAENTLAVLANGTSYFFYINGREVFNVRNAALTDGSFGLIVRSRASEQTTITFDDFNVWSVPVDSLP